MPRYPTNYPVASATSHHHVISANWRMRKCNIGFEAVPPPMTRRCDFRSLPVWNPCVPRTTVKNSCSIRYSIDLLRHGSSIVLWYVDTLVVYTRTPETDILYKYRYIQTNIFLFKIHDRKIVSKDTCFKRRESYFIFKKKKKKIVHWYFKDMFIL